MFSSFPKIKKKIYDQIIRTFLDNGKKNNIRRTQGNFSPPCCLFKKAYFK